MKKLSFFRLFGFILGALCLMAVPVKGLTAEITLKAGHCAPIGPTSYDIAAKKLAERMAVNTGGRVEIKVFGNSQFGTIAEHWGQIKSGAIDIFVQDACAGFMVEPKPKNFMILLFPYIFESQDHVKKFYRSDLCKSMMAKVEKAANIKFIGYLGDRSPRVFSTKKKKVSTPVELKGMKLCVPAVPPFVAAYKSWGANPTPLAAKEIYSALKSGMVDGLDFSFTMMASTKFYEPQKYITAINYMRSGVGAWINGDKWQSLPKDVQEAFLKSVKETETYTNEITAKQMVESEKTMTDAGLEIIQPDLKPWMEIAEKEVRKQEGKLWEKGLYDRIKALK